MDEVNCTGQENYLSACSFSGWGIHDCSHYEDAGVICPRMFSVIGVTLV